jgi:hypothetical protein
MTFPDSSPLPRAYFPTPTFNSVLCTCSAMPKLISANPMLASSSSAGEPSSLPGISRSPINSSNNSAIASPKTIPLSSPNYVRSACTTWLFLTIRKTFVVLSPPRMKLTSPFHRYFLRSLRGWHCWPDFLPRWLFRAGLFPAGKKPLIASLGLFRCGPFLVPYGLQVVGRCRTFPSATVG